MQKKLTITVDEAVHQELESAYAQMAKDMEREKEAEEWAEITFKDLAHETA